MNQCLRHEDDLALLAGGDLAQSKADAVLAHASSCTACAALLRDLRADQGALASLRAGVAETPAAEGPQLGEGRMASSVMRRVEAMEALGSGLGGRRLLRGASVAAALVLVASVVAVVRLTPRGASRGGDAKPVAAQAQVVHELAPETASAVETEDFRPVWVKKGPGQAVELTWQGDGREDADATTYKVLASASPRDFSSARPVEVAGNHLVATMALPALRAPDRSVTYFRVQ
jgi:hypothetical protein